MMFFFVVGIGSTCVLFFIGTLNNIEIHRNWVAAICGTISIAIFLVVIRGLRKEAGSMLFSDGGILVRRPFERIGIFNRKPRKEFISVEEIQTLRIKLHRRGFTRFYIEKLNGETVELGFVPADPLWMTELIEFVTRRKIPIELKFTGPDIH